MERFAWSCPAKSSGQYGWPPKADIPDEDSVSIETVEADDNLKTVHDGAVRAILTETGLWELPSGETPVSAAQNTTDEAVASASEGA